jgi:hypothetical protein
MEDLVFLFLMIYVELTINQVNCVMDNGRPIKRKAEHRQYIIINTSNLMQTQSEQLDFSLKH